MSAINSNPPYIQYLDATLDALRQLPGTGDQELHASRKSLLRLSSTKPATKQDGGPPVLVLHPEDGINPADRSALRALLDNILKAMKLHPDETAVLNTAPDEGWKSWVTRNRPRVILCPGPDATRCASFPDMKPGEWRDLHGAQVIATIPLMEIHARGDLTLKRSLWEHMLQVLEKLGKPVTAAQRNYFQK